MRFLLLIKHNEREWTNLPAAQREETYTQYRELIANLANFGQLLDADQFLPSDRACIVRNDGAEVSTAAVAGENPIQAGGFMLIDVADRAAAIGVAGRIPGVCDRSVEVWPISPRFPNN